MSTLIVILGSIRADDSTFDNFKTNLFDVVDADLCICIGVGPDYNYENPYHKLAKYKFLYDEPYEYTTAFDYANNILKNINDSDHMHWRHFLKIKTLMGGINQNPGSGALQIFYRWFLLHNLLHKNLLHKYERFIITRSDFMYQMPHPKLTHLDSTYIWIPNSEYYNGYTDRHAVLSKYNILSYLNILHNMSMQSKNYLTKMMHISSDWNIEKLIKFHLTEENMLNYVREYPYIMYTVRELNGKTRWALGVYVKELGYFIKYQSEYDKSIQYKNEYDSSGLTIDEFYKKKICNT